MLLCLSVVLCCPCPVFLSISWMIEVIYMYVLFLPQTPGRKRPPTASTRRALAEKNHDPSPDESVYSQANFSLASTGSYTDFQV